MQQTPHFRQPLLPGHNSGLRHHQVREKVVEVAAKRGVSLIHLLRYGEK